jgi:chromosome segregation ATPase
LSASLLPLLLLSLVTSQAIFAQDSPQPLSQPELLVLVTECDQLLTEYRSTIAEYSVESQTLNRQIELLTNRSTILARQLDDWQTLTNEAEALTSELRTYSNELQQRVVSLMTQRTILTISVSVLGAGVIGLIAYIIGGAN